MKLIIISIIFLLPGFASAQLFPKIVDFHGNISMVTEKRYGKELSPTKKDSGLFKPGKYSGWKYTYLFDENSKIVKQTNTFQDKIQSVYTYQRSKIGDRMIEREIIENDKRGLDRNAIEYENFIDTDGRIVKVNYWSVDTQTNSRLLFLTELNAEYKLGKLISFIRHNIDETGKIDTGERCELYYDSAGRLIRIERKDIESNLKTVLDYTYNQRGFLDHYSVDFLVGIPVYGKNPKQDIYYKCDSQGNWIKKYWLTDKKKLVEAKRIIKYK
jgi:YD repeat-containing protein